jgi:hypothetical protein
MLMKSHKFIGVCFGVWLWLFIVACSVNNPATMTTSQIAAASVVDGRIKRALGCNKPSEYSFLVVQNPKRKDAKDLNVVVGDEVIAKIELPNLEVNNFSLNSVAKNKAGFEVKVDWGGGVYHYEIQYNFRCKENNFYLYKVRKVSFSTKNPDSGSFLDVKRTRVIRVEPNLPIEKFVMTDYL